MTLLARATHIEAEAGVRYWEDASVNEVAETDDAPTIPLRNGDAWCPRIRLADGVVEDWPAGTTAETHYKVCDQGIYWLTDATGVRLARWRGHYVPSAFLCHGGSGYGDYIILSIDGDGRIADYAVPEVMADEWIAA